MRKNLLNVFILFGLITLSSFSSIAQCNMFVKKKCIPNVQPFTHNGQTNTTTLRAGQSAELKMTFFSGQDYRILICAQEVLGELTFRILDASNKVVFDSKQNDYTDFWDFKVQSTQQFVVEVTVPPSDSPNSIVPSGCVSVLVGFKKSE